MSKFVSLSFDDGRLDTYTVALPVMEKYGLAGTVNVVSDFVLNPEKYDCFRSAGNLAMSRDQVLDLRNRGFEIACHGATHDNSVEDVKQNISELKDMGIDVRGIGFASPRSALTEDNSENILRLVGEGTLSYVRSGIQTRREGAVYFALSIAERIFHGKRLFRRLNKRNIMNAGALPALLRSVAVTRYTSVAQIVSFLESLGDNEIAILVFHSILQNPPAEKDNWYWTADRFELVCKWLSEHAEYKVCKTAELLPARAAQ